MPYGGLYSKLSAASLADPKNAQLQGLVQTSFRGTTLRGLLLEAYAFSKIGTVTLWGALASFVAVARLSVLVGWASGTLVAARSTSGCARRTRARPPDDRSATDRTRHTDAPAGTTGGSVSRAYRRDETSHPLVSMKDARMSSTFGFTCLSPRACGWG
jgi:hypothetical protein